MMRWAGLCMVVALSGCLSAPAQAQTLETGKDTTPTVITPTTSAPAQTAPVQVPGRFGGKDGVFRMVIVGDVLARGLGAGLERLTELDPRFEVVSRNNESSGLARPEVYDWPTTLPKILNEGNFDAVIVFLGTNDRQPIRVGEARVEFGTPQWAAAYRIKTDSLIRRIEAAGAKVYWVNLPPMANPEFNGDMRLIASIHRERVTKEEGQYLDFNGDLSNPDGSYMESDKDEKGNNRRLRNRDGVSFSRNGNNMLGELVMSSIRTREGAAELAASGGEDAEEEEKQEAEALPPAGNSPLFGQPGVDGGTLTFEAKVIAETPVQTITPDTSTLGKLGIKVSVNSLAQRFYRSGIIIGAPYGRFDDFSVTPR